MKKLLLLLLCVPLMGLSQNPCFGRYQTEIFNSVSVTTVNYSDVYSDNAHTMDIYTPDGDTVSNRPLILYLHGGGFTVGDKSNLDCIDFCTSMAKRGYIAASINYRLENALTFILNTSSQYEAILKAVADAKAAVRYFRKDFSFGNAYGIDTSTIFIGGYSAGAITSLHLAYVDDISDLPTSPVNVQNMANNLGGLDGDAGNFGYNSSVQGIVSFAGAIHDLNWINISDEPLVSVHGTFDVAVPYNCGPGFNNSTVLTLCGAGTIHPIADILGLYNSLLTLNGVDHTWAAYGNTNPLFVNAINFSVNFLYPLLPCTFNYGCTDPIACNYDPSAITDDGSCIFQENPIDNMSDYTYNLSFHWGCSGNTYSAEMEFDSTANGVVNAGTFGATNVTWSLCDSVLTWVYTDGTQYTSNSYDNGTFTGTMLSGSGSSTGCFTLTPIIAGCLDSTSLLYDPQANIDDGSCCANYLRLNMYSSWPGGWSGGIYWTMMDDNGDTVISTALTYNSSTDTYHNVDYICIPDGCYTIVCSNGGGSGGVSWTLKDDSTNSTIVSGGCPFGPYITAIGTSCVVMGCTDPNANNYYPHANLDDGSCTYSCGPITGVYMSDIIHDRATFNWDNMNSQYCQVDQIRIRYREVGTSSWSTKTMGVPVGSGCNTSNTSKRILSLSANTTYEYKFKIWYCNASTVIWHANGTFTTLPVCDNVINVTVTPLNNVTKADFCWDSVSTYAFVRLKYREDVPGSSFNNIGGMGVLSPTLCKEKGGITPGLNYRVMWRTWCSPNGGPYRSPQWDGPVTWTQPNSIRIEDGTSINNLEVYPNPSRDVFNVSFISDNKQSIEVRVVNLLGESIFTDNLKNFEGEYSHSFNLSEYSKGIYLLELDTDNGIVNKKLILQ